ncbi:unnamed protein product [Closterium sp. NIES-54]
MLPSTPHCHESHSEQVHLLTHPGNPSNGLSNGLSRLSPPPAPCPLASPLSALPNVPPSSSPTSSSSSSSSIPPPFPHSPPPVATSATSLACCTPRRITASRGDTLASHPAANESAPTVIHHAVDAGWKRQGTPPPRRTRSSSAAPAVSAAAAASVDLGWEKRRSAATAGAVDGADVAAMTAVCRQLS